MEWYWILLIVIGSLVVLLSLMTIFYNPFFKRVCDIVCALAVFIFLWPLYLVVAILVKTKLGSPIYFKQVRPGKDGKFFTMYKFRSMTDEKDENGNLLPDGERLTKFGKWLRKTSLDEMPEAINILKGEMSVIGPRPLLVKDYVFFSDEVKRRQNVRPGLSGLAQINGRNGISWEEKFKFDLKYIEHVSLWKDIKIVLSTIFKAFVKKENIDRQGFDTDEDYGAFLLRNKQITVHEHEHGLFKANEAIIAYEKQ